MLTHLNDFLHLDIILWGKTGQLPRVGGNRQAPVVSISIDASDVYATIILLGKKVGYTFLGVTGRLHLSWGSEKQCSTHRDAYTVL